MTNSILSALVNGAIAGALLAAAIRSGLFLARRMFSSSARHATWWAALLAVALLPLAYLPAPTNLDSARHPAVPVAQTTAAPAPTSQAPLTPLTHPANAVHPRFPLVLIVGSWSRWIPDAWAVLSGLMLLRLLASCILLERRKSGAVAAPAELIGRIDASLAGRGWTRRAAVLRSAKIRTPMLAGLRRPAILIPERLFTELTEEELTQIGLHEAAHAARRDDYALLAARAIQALLPFHPVVPWIVRQIGLERELACDDFVLETTGAPRSYAACLLHVVELCSGDCAPWAATGVTGNRSQLSRRVERLLDRNLRTDARPAKARLLAAIGVVAALACLMGRAPRAIALAIPQAAVKLPPIASPPAPAVTQTPAPVVSVEQQISEVAADDPPLSVEIVVDMSGSMRNKQALVDAAVTQLVKSANPADEFLVMTFNDQVEVVGTFANDSGQILDQLHLSQPRGGTALRDAMLQAAEWKNARYPGRILVVISDGDDNSSFVTIGQLRDAAIAARAPIWAITLASPALYPRRQSLWLGELADQSLGREFVADDPGQAANAAASIAKR